MDSEQYARFVKTDCWQIRKNKYMRDQTRCEMCGMSWDEFGLGTVRIDVHHLSYQNFGHEPDADLIALCHVCHDIMHGYCKSEFRVTIALSCAEVRHRECSHEMVEQRNKMAKVIERIAEMYPQAKAAKC